MQPDHFGQIGHIDLGPVGGRRSGWFRATRKLRQLSDPLANQLVRQRVVLDHDERRRDHHEQKELAGAVGQEGKSQKDLVVDEVFADVQPVEFLLHWDFVNEGFRKILADCVPVPQVGDRRRRNAEYDRSRRTVQHHEEPEISDFDVCRANQIVAVVVRVADCSSKGQNLTTLHAQKFPPNSPSWKNSANPLTTFTKLARFVEKINALR